MKNIIFILLLPFCTFAQTFVPDSRFMIPQKPDDTVGITSLIRFVKNNYKDEYLIQGNYNFLDNTPATSNKLYCIQDFGDTKKINAWDAEGGFLFVRNNGNYVLRQNTNIIEVNAEGKTINSVNYRSSSPAYNTITDKMYYFDTRNTPDGQWSYYLFSLDFSGKIDSIATNSHNYSRISLVGNYFFLRSDETPCSFYKVNEKLEIDSTFQKIPCLSNEYGRIYTTATTNEIITMDYTDSTLTAIKYSAQGEKIDSLVLSTNTWEKFTVLGNGYFSILPTSSSNTYGDYYYLDDNLKQTLVPKFDNYFYPSITSFYTLDKEGNVWYNDKKIVTCKTIEHYDSFNNLTRVNDSTFVCKRNKTIDNYIINTRTFIIFNQNGEILYEFPYTSILANQKGNILLTDGDSLYHVTPDLKLQMDKDTLKGKKFFIDFPNQNLYEITKTNKILKFSLQTKEQDSNFQLQEEIGLIKYISFFKNGDLAISTVNLMFYKVNQAGNVSFKTIVFNHSRQASIFYDQLLDDEKYIYYNQLSDDEKYIYTEFTYSWTEGVWRGSSLLDIEKNTLTNPRIDIASLYFDETDKKDKFLENINPTNEFTENFYIRDLANNIVNNITIRTDKTIYPIKKSKDGFIGMNAKDGKIYKFINDSTSTYLLGKDMFIYQDKKKYKIPYEYRGKDVVKIELLEGKSKIEGDSLVITQADSDYPPYTLVDTGKIKLSATDVSSVVISYTVSADSRAIQNLSITTLPTTLNVDSTSTVKFICTSSSGLAINLTLNGSMAYFKTETGEKVATMTVPSGAESQFYLTGQVGTINLSASAKEDNQYRPAYFTKSIQVIKSLVLANDNPVENIYKIYSNPVENIYKIYPNPVINNQLTIQEYDNLPLSNFSVVDMKGQSYSVDVKQIGNAYQVTLPMLNEGIYVFSFANSVKTIHKRIVINK